MANKQIKFTFQAPATADGAFELEATGGYTGDLLHVHQHTGSPMAGTDLIHAEAASVNVLPLRLTAATAGTQAATITGLVSASGFSGPLTGAVTGNASTASAFDHDPSACGGGAYATDQSASGVLTCSIPPGTYTLPDAAAGAKGGIFLTGQLGGTAASPTVTGLTCTGCVGSTQAAALDAGDVTTGTFVASQIPDATGAAKGAIILTGDLGGTAASPSVVDDSHAHTTTTISGLDASNDFTAGTLPQARGGMGVTSLTCAGTDKVTCNGTTCSCATDVGGTYTLPALTSSVLGGVKGTGAALVCSGTDKMTGFDAAGAMQCSTDLGGGAAPNYVEVDADFGVGSVLAEQGIVTVVVTGQAWVTATSKIVCNPTMYATSTRDEGMEDAVLDHLEAFVYSRVVGTGFTLAATAPTGAVGIYKFNCIGG
jgi:hypothetical protein